MPLARLGNPMPSEPGEVTQLLQDFTRGDPVAGDKLIPLVYQELKRQAQRQLHRERIGHTLQPTALVHEAFLRLVGQRRANWKNRAHFFGVAAQLMRRILIDYARGRQRFKRGGDQQRVPLEETHLVSEEQSKEWIALDEALHRLTEMDERQSRIVELRVFGGLTTDETAEVLDISASTVLREWNVAKVWLHREIRLEGVS